MHKTHIVFENLSNINGDMLQKAWGFEIDEDGMQSKHYETRLNIIRVANLSRRT